MTPIVSQHDVDHRAVGGGREPERVRLRQPLDRLARARQQRQVLAVAGQHRLDDGRR